MMFDKEYSFRGKHAEYVVKLTAEYDDKHHKLFNTNYDVYAVAPIIGFLYQRKAELDKTGDATKIFPDKLIKEQQNLLFNYRLIMLLDEKHEPDFNERINKAFRYYGQEKAKPDEELYENYVRGGVEVLFEKLIEPARSADDYLTNLYDFMSSGDTYSINRSLEAESMVWSATQNISPRGLSFSDWALFRSSPVPATTTSTLIPVSFSNSGITALLRASLLAV